MAIIVGGRAVVFGLQNGHELNGEIVYVECSLHEAIEPDYSIYAVIGGYGHFEYQIAGKNLLALDDRDDHTIEEYSKEHWEPF